MKEKISTKPINSLQSLINIGPATEKRLQAIDVTIPSQLKRSKPETVYEKLKQKEGGHLDICVLYQIRGAILGAPWWICKNPKGDKKYDR